MKLMYCKITIKDIISQYKQKLIAFWLRIASLTLMANSQNALQIDLGEKNLKTQF